MESQIRPHPVIEFNPENIKPQYHATKKTIL